jgi:hypothetical protein
VFDLIGNVLVWIDACRGNECRCAGESSQWRSSEASGGREKCPGRRDTIDANPPEDGLIDLGFRCCATPK